MTANSVGEINLHAVKNLYNSMARSIKLATRLSEEFEILTDSRQGFEIAPSLFTIYLNLTLNQWRPSAGIRHFLLVMANLIYTLQMS